MKLLLISPPFITCTLPATGISLLKSVMQRAGIATEVLYGNLAFSSGLFPGQYENFIHSLNFNNFLLGDYLFAPYAFPDAPRDEAAFIRAYERELDFQQKHTLPGQYIPLAEITRLGERIPAFLDEFTGHILEKSPDLVGFSVLSNQLGAALALARRIKAERPTITTLLGGWACNHPMGEAISRIAPALDYIFSGEAETALLHFCQELQRGHTHPAKVVSGQPPADLDSLPFPDYSDYFAQLKAYRLRGHRRIVNMQSSRGCWWGKCLFCGEKHSAQSYRQKSQAKIREELLFLDRTYSPARIDIHDYVVSPQLLQTLLATGGEPPWRSRLFMEVRVTLDFATLKSLKAAGLDQCQAGIESLDDHILRIIQKGTRAADNLRFLRDCRLLGIKPLWGFMLRLPGETQEDYQQMLGLLPAVAHLPPPAGLRPLALTRYSPLAERTEEYGLHDVRPFALLEGIYPPETELEQLAPFFETHYASPLDEATLRNAFCGALARWIKMYQKAPPVLQLFRLRADLYLLQDSRALAARSFRVLTAAHARVLRRLRVPGAAQLQQELSPAEVRAWQELEAASCLVHTGKQCLSLVCEPFRLLAGEEQPAAGDGPPDTPAAARLEALLNNRPGAFARLEQNPGAFLAEARISLSTRELARLREQLQISGGQAESPARNRGSFQD